LIFTFFYRQRNIAKFELRAAITVLWLLALIWLNGALRTVHTHPYTYKRIQYPIIHSFHLADETTK